MTHTVLTPVPTQTAPVSRDTAHRGWLTVDDSSRHHRLRHLLRAILATIPIVSPLAAQAGQDLTCVNTRTNETGQLPNWGAVYNLFSSQQELVVQVTCAAGVPQLTVGSDKPDQLIFDTAYIKRNGQWQAFSLSGPERANEDYFRRRAYGPLPLTTNELPGRHEVTAYTCTWYGQQWRLRHVEHGVDDIEVGDPHVPPVHGHQRADHFILVFGQPHHATSLHEAALVV
jgi:hypothetical protein